MVKLREYVDKQGRSAFNDWFDGLHAMAATQVTAVLERMEKGNLSNVAPVVEAFRNTS